MLDCNRNKKGKLCLDFIVFSGLALLKAALQHSCIFKINIYVYIYIYIYIYIQYIYIYIINVFTFTFDQFNASLPNKSMNLF